MTRFRSRSVAALVLLAVALQLLPLPTLGPAKARAQAPPLLGLYLDSNGGECKNRPSPTATTFTLASAPPTETTAKCRDSSAVGFAGGNPWAPVGAWTTTPAAGTLSALEALHVWIGLKNSDDQGTQFDVLAEVFKGGTLLASGLTRCVTGLTRNQKQAREIVVSFGPVTPTPFDGAADVLAVKLSTRIGTTSDGAKCPGPGGSHASAVGLRVYYDGAGVASGLGAAVLPGGDRPPVFSSTPPTVAVEMTPYAYRVAAQDPEGQTVTFQLVRGPTGMTMDPGTAVLGWVPSRGQAGDHRVEVRATDGNGTSISQTYTLTVVPFNLNPTITSVPGTFVRVGQEYVYDVDAFDPEGAAVTFAFAEPPPAGMTIDPTTGVVRWSPAAAAVGRHRVSVNATDPLGAADTQIFSLDVIGAAATLQIVSPVAPQAVGVGQILTLPLQASDARAVITVEPLPANASATGTTFSFTPVASQAGTHTIAVRARLADMVTSTVVPITVTRGNAAPQLSAVGPQTVAEGGSLTFAVQATDPDGDPLTYQASGLPQNAFFNAITRQFAFFPAGGQAGDHQVTFAVSDRRASAQITVPIRVTAGPGGGTQVLDLAIDPPQNPTFDTRQTIRGSVLGQVGPPPPAQRPVLITGLSPATVQQGRAATVDIAGINTAFAQATARADFGAGITVDSLTVLSPTSARASIRADRHAQVGARQVVMKGAGRDVPAIVEFRVEPGVVTITGVVLDPFTQQPLAGALVTVQGSDLSVLTDAQGRFTLSGVTPGSVTVLVTRPNYSVQTLRLAVGPSDTVTLAQPIALNALARPASPGGTLPRAQTVASVLDRGVTRKGGGITLEQAKTLIADTLVAVGGSQVGVLDEGGRQLNPRVLGHGILSLTPRGVESHARALIEGDVHTLGEFIWTVLTLYRFVVPIAEGDVLAGFQRAVDGAWADPGSPLSAMPIVLFNEGTTLSPQPPILSMHTRLNRFQCFLLMSSFLLNSRPALEAAADAVLRAKGYDPNNLPPLAARDAGPRSMLGWLGRPGEALGVLAGALAGWIVPQAHAAPVIQSGSDTHPYGRQVYTNTYRYVRGNMIAEAFMAGIIPAMIAAVAMHVTFMGGGLLGAVGALTAFGVITSAFMIGFGQALFMKMVFLWAAGGAGALAPEAAQVISAARDVEGNLVILVERSANEIRHLNGQGPAPGLLNPKAVGYAYHLYRFTTCFDEDLDRGVWQHVLARPDDRDPRNSQTPAVGRLKFVIPKFKLEGGSGFFKVVTFQYIQSPELVEGVDDHDRPDATGQRDGVLSPEEFVQAGLGSRATSFPMFDVNGTGTIEDSELSRRVVTDNPVARATGLPDDEAFSPFRLQPPPSPRVYKQTVSDRQSTLQIEIERAAAEEAAAFERHRDLSLPRLQVKNAELRRQRRALDSARINQLFQPEDIHNFRTGRSLIEFKSLLQSTHTGGPTGLRDGNPQALQAFRERFLRDPTTEEVDLLTDLAERDMGRQRAQFASTTVATGMSNMETTRNWIASLPADDPTEFVDVKFARLDAGGAVTEVTERVVIDRANRMRTVLGIDLKIEIVRHDYHDTLARMRQAEANYQALMPLAYPAEARLQADTRARAMELLDSALDANHKAAVSIRKDIAALNERPRTSFYTAPRYLGLGLASDTAGGVVMAVDNVAQFLRNVQVLSSEFSACVPLQADGPPVPTEEFPPTLVVHPDRTEHGSVLSVQPDNFKGGFVRRHYPFGHEGEDNAETGFPPQHITTDRLGRIYVINKNSNLQFGGRIFRFTPVRLFESTPENPIPFGMQDRQHVGSVNYYSVLAQYGRPAYPVAMVAGPPFSAQNTNGTDIEVQDLYVATVDVVDGKKKILRVPISLIELNPAGYTRPAWNTPINRDHLVGQPIIESDDLVLTGPSDMEIGPDPEHGPDPARFPFTAANGVLMLSDEESIWAIRHVNTAPELVRVIHSPGRRWSGLAFDPRGNFYFADFRSGEVWVLRWNDLRRRVLGQIGPFGEFELLTNGYLLSAGHHEPGDIEIEGGSGPTYGRTFFVSTPFGIDRLPLPIVGRLDPSVSEVKVRRQTKESPVEVRPGPGRVYRVAPSMEDLATLEAKLVVKRTDPATGRTRADEIPVELEEFGITIADLPGTP